MKFNRIIQSLLFALVIVGGFASMAKNAYGFIFMGVACFGLTLLYFTQVIWKLIEDHSALGKKDIGEFAELLLLAVLLMLFGLRALYIYLANGELYFFSVCALLVVVYFLAGYGIFATTIKESPGLAWNMVSFYSSVLLFILYMLTRVLTSWSLLFGALGMLVSLPFIFSLVRQRHYEYSGKSTSLFQFVATSKNKAGLLFLFFIVSGIYVGLSSLNIIPVIENAARPKAYIELIDKAESGREKPVDGKYQHEAYKEAMDKFLERHGSK